MLEKHTPVVARTSFYCLMLKRLWDLWWWQTVHYYWWRFLNVVRRHKLQQATRGRQWDGISDIPVITHGATGNAWFLWRKKSFRSHSLLKGLFFADCPRLYKLATVIVCHQKRNQVLLMPDNPQFRKKVHNLRIITHRYQQADYTRCELPVSSSLVASSDVNWLKAPLYLFI